MISAIFFLFLVILYATAATSKVEFAPVVQLKNGKVQGIVSEVHEEGKVYAYHGIRYGKSF